LVSPRVSPFPSLCSIFLFLSPSIHFLPFPFFLHSGSTDAITKHDAKQEDLVLVGDGDGWSILAPHHLPLLHLPVPPFLSLLSFRFLFFLHSGSTNAITKHNAKQEDLVLVGDGDGVFSPRVEEDEDGLRLEELQADPLWHHFYLLYGV